MRLAEGEKSEVNGMAVKGPLTIFERSNFLEASAVTFGFDSNTESKVSGFSADSHLTLSLILKAIFKISKMKGLRTACLHFLRGQWKVSMMIMKLVTRMNNSRRSCTISQWEGVRRNGFSASKRINQ